MNYASADAQLQGRCKASRKIANNTYLKRRGESIAVKLHETDVATMHPDGSVTLQSGGWKTMTTKDRMNYVQGMNVWSDRGVWYVGGCPWMDKAPQAHVYAEGMTVLPDGGVRYNGEQPQDPKEQQKLRKRVREYARKFVALFEAGKIEKPGLGDCWFCAMVTDEGQTLGEAMSGADHILSHLGGTEEQPKPYYVPSLFARACKGRVSPAAEGWIAAIWYPELYASEEEAMNVRKGWGRNIVVDQCRKALRKYMAQQLGLGEMR